MSDRSTVSLYIPCYNGEQYIAACIEGVLGQFRKPDEIFVIDDGSTDRTAEIASSYPQVTVIRHEDNRGLSVARNTAIRAATGDFVAALDADCHADKLWLYTLLQVMNSLPDSVVGIGGKLVEEFHESPADEFRAIFMSQHKGDEPLTDPGYVAGANTMFRRSALLEVGGYHEAFRTNGEDVLICRKLKARGYSVVYDPRAVVNHQRRDTSASVVRMNWAHWRYPMAILTPMTNLGRVWPRMHMRTTYGVQLVRVIVKMRKYRLLGIGLRCLLVTPFWELRDWWRIKRDKAEERYEQIAKDARTLSLQPLESSAAPLVTHN